MRYTILLSLLTILLQSQTIAQPLLNSYPTAAPTIFLDFDGHLVEGTSWNYDGPIHCGASGLTPAQITEVFNRVAEDYRPFVVNITTDSTKFLSAPIDKRMRVIITVSSQWYGTAGGVALVGSFSWGTDDPCFVFSQLLNFNVKNVSEATAHESGHTLGLFHQSSYDANCVKTSDYHYGNGSGETGWAPIMGVGYYRNLTIWHNGPNPYGCNTNQNDMNVIASAVNGITIKTDDNNNTAAAAPPLIITNNTFSSSGTFEQTNDADLYKISLPAAARLLLNAKPVNVGNQNAGGNSDISVELYNNTMNLIKTSNPIDSLQATIDSMLTTGTYYIRLKPIANSYTGTYGMTGTYIITGSAIPATILPLRKLELTGKTNGTTHYLNWQIDADEQITEASLEYSINGVSFSSIYTTRDASGNFSYYPNNSNITIYRMKVQFDNGKSFYSKSIQLKTAVNEDEPMIISNPVSNGMITVDGNSSYKYMIFDNQGKNITNGLLKEGITTIPFHQVSSGMYLIRFIKNNGLTCTRKIIVR